MPGTHTCLKESIIVHLYLRKKGIILPINLGISTKNDLKAHAWYDNNEVNDFNKITIRNDQESRK